MLVTASLYYPLDNEAGEFQYPDVRYHILQDWLIYISFVWSFDRKTYTWSSPKSSHSWNPADFMKSVKSGGFHPWNPADFMKSVKSGGFHPEIQWISPWNLADFTREIWQISPWNLVDFTREIWWISPRYQLWNPPKIIKASVSAKTLQFDECRVGDFTLEIHQISPWNLVDFTCEIWQISPRFHLWNPPKIIKASVLAKTLQFDECRVGAMTKDFMKFTLKSGWFHPWNLADFTQISPVKSTQNYKSKCFSKNSSVWWMQGRDYDQGFHLWNPAEFTLKSGRFDLWNPVDFTQISPVKSTQNYKSKCFSKNSSVWWMQGGGFHPEIWWISPMKSGRFHPDITCEIHPKL